MNVNAGGVIGLIVGGAIGALIGVSVSANVSNFDGSSRLAQIAGFGALIGGFGGNYLWQQTIGKSERGSGRRRRDED